MPHPQPTPAPKVDSLEISEVIAAAREFAECIGGSPLLLPIPVARALVRLEQACQATKDHQLTLPPPAAPLFTYNPNLE